MLDRPCFKSLNLGVSASHSALQGTRIMVVDDDPGIGALLSEMLLSQDAQTTVVSDSLDALERISREPVDLMTVDLMMPGIDGIELCRRVRAAHPEIGLVVISGSRDVSMAIEAMKLGALDYILKPFSLETVITVLTGALDKSRQSRAQHAAQQRGESPNGKTEGVLEALVAALDAREHETKNHSRRVTCYAMRLGQALDMNQRDLEILRQGAILHDIGKIGIPDGILLKAGPLTDHEWDLMRKHPEIAYRILDSIDELKPASEIVLSHHERFQGGGYPRGLKGSRILLGARIFSIADTLDAITSDRPYRRARSFQAASEEIVRCAGTQFDPEVVAAFSAVSIHEWQEMRTHTLRDPGCLADIPGLGQLAASLPLSGFDLQFDGGFSRPS